MWKIFFPSMTVELQHVPTDIIPLMLLLEVDAHVRCETRLADYNHINGLLK